MHTDVEFHRLDGIPNRILRRDRGLNRDRALHRSDCAGEVGDDAVAGGVEFCSSCIARRSFGIAWSK
jgi:hypothetical protein